MEKYGIKSVLHHDSFVLLILCVSMVSVVMVMQVKKPLRKPIEEEFDDDLYNDLYGDLSVSTAGDNVTEYEVFYLNSQ